MTTQVQQSISAPADSMATPAPADSMATPAPSETATPTPSASAHNGDSSVARKTAFLKRRANERQVLKSFLTKYIEQDSKARMASAHDRRQLLEAKMLDKLKDRRQQGKALASDYEGLYDAEVENQWLLDNFKIYLETDGGGGREEEMDDEEANLSMGPKYVKKEEIEEGEVEVPRQLEQKKAAPVIALRSCRRDHMVRNQSEKILRLNKEFKRRQERKRAEAGNGLEVVFAGSWVAKDVQGTKREAEDDGDVVAKRHKYED